MESKTKRCRFFHKHKLGILMGVLALVGILCGVRGFSLMNSEGVPNTYSDRFYEIFRMFTLNYQFDYQSDNQIEGKNPINGWLEISRWSIFLVIILFSFKLFFRILAPKAISNFIVRYRYKNHIVICDMNELSADLMMLSEYVGNKIVIVSDKGREYFKNFKQRKIRVVEGNPNDTHILELANIQNADQLYILSSEDQLNVEIAHKAFSLLKQRNGKKRKLSNPLKCFTLVHDMALKKILEESPLFNYSVKSKDEKFFFDGILCNIVEIGIKFGLHKQFEHIFSKGIAQNPSILIDGLGTEAEHVITNLAHALTPDMQPIRFTIVEKNEENIRQFKQKYNFLQEFINLEFIHADISDGENPSIKPIFNNINQYSSLIVCCNNQIDNLKNAWFLSKEIHGKYPPIITFCHQRESLSSVLNMESNEKEALLKEKNIYVVNTFEEFFHYTVQLNEEIEKLAQKTHALWNEKSPHKVSYDHLSEHFKQSNRNQILDMYYKLFLLNETAWKDHSKSNKTIALTQKERELLAIMEHRRWTIEKLASGWKYGIDRADKYKIHDCIKPWDQLSQFMKDKDFDAVDLMLEVLNGKENA